MAPTTITAGAPAIPSDVLELVRRTDDRQLWDALSADIPAWHPRNEGEPPPNDPAAATAAAAEAAAAAAAAANTAGDPKDDKQPTQAEKDLAAAIAEQDRLKAELQKHEDAQLSEKDLAEKRATEAESEAGTLKADNLRLRVALKKGLVGERLGKLVDLLKGDDEAALEKHADELLEQFGETPGPRPGDLDQGRRDAGTATDMNDAIRQRIKR